jgi:hypothetical protein
VPLLPLNQLATRSRQCTRTAATPSDEIEPFRPIWLRLAFEEIRCAKPVEGLWNPGLNVRKRAGKSRDSRMPFVFRLIASAMLFAGLSEASAAPAFEIEAICRTAVASIMGRDPKMMQVTLTAGNVVSLTYVRPIDNFVWTYRCRIEGNRVVWAAESGRWRDDPTDEKVFFEVVEGGKQ